MSMPPSEHAPEQGQGPAWVPCSGNGSGEGGGEHESELQQLRDTVDHQARTIRVLLSNYDALLKKFEREHGNGEHEHYRIVWSAGESRHIANNGKIDAGWWQSRQAGSVRLNDHAGGHHTYSLEALEPFFSEGNAEVAHSSGLDLVPILSTVAPVEG